jgi:antitoxin YefM
MRTVSSTFSTIVKEERMKSINYTTFRKNLAKTIDQVNDNHCPILITRQNGRTAVLLSFDDFTSYEETAYLMKSPKNAERLNIAIAELEAGKGIERGLIEE